MKSSLVPITLLTFVLNTLLACGQTSIGWRTNGTGRYPKATPPIEWSQEKNVVWKTKMPGSSYGSPVIVDGKIFVVSDPAELLCLKESDGKILWQKSLSVSKVMGEKKAEQIADAWKKINNRRSQLQREYSELRKKQPNAKELQQKARERVREVDVRIQEFKRKNPVPRRGGSGNSAGTPVSGGKRIYCSFGSGIVAAFDLDGNIVWAKFIEGSEINFGHSSSLVLADGKLIVHYHDLIALNAADGKELWRKEIPPRHATAIVAQIGNESVLVVPSGVLVRVRDGKIIAEHNSLRVSECSPILDAGIVYTQSGKTSAFRLPKTTQGEIKLEPLWQVGIASGRRTPSPVLHDGLLYGVTTRGMLDVVDVQSGKSLYRERLELGNVYSSLTIAGDYLFISGTRGDTLVLKTGRTFQPVARNNLESFGSCPVFKGDRMYVRCQRFMYCIGK